MNLVEVLRDRAALHPDRPALIDPSGGRERSVTFAELATRVGAGAARLEALGLKRGDTILAFQPVSIELYELLLSALHGGMRVMLADPSAGGKFLTLCCGRLPPDAFFGPWKAHLLRLLIPALRRIPLAIRSSGWFPAASAWRSNGNAVPLAEVPDDEPALLTFTSGSTGVPKAAVRTHGFLLAQHRALSRALDFEEGEVDLITLPVFVLANLASGLTSVLADTDLRSPGKADATSIRSQCERHGVNRCAASPAFFEALLAGPPLPPLKKIYTGGAPVFPDLLDRLQIALPEAEVTAVFGSTEAEPMTHLGASEYQGDLLARTASGGGLCAGLPVPEVELRIIRDHWGHPLTALDAGQFAALVAEPGTPGEVIVSGDHVLSGYLGGVGDTETKICMDGKIWHRTGDAGWLDAEGRLWLLGRCAAKLPAAPAGRPDLPEGALDYPFAIESALRARYPRLLTAALGWKDKRVLVTTSEAPPGLEEVAAEFGIEEVIRVPTLPMDRRHNAKIDYPALKAMLSKEGARPAPHSSASSK
jgi:acyl-CoA synthetase (AMP-forming)/AMP-acid ligase II